MNDDQVDLTTNWIGALVSSTVHDLNKTVLNISTGLRLLEHRLERDAPFSPQEQLTLIRGMQDDLRLMREIVGSLAVLRHLEPVACDFVEDVIEPAIRNTRSRLRRRILIAPNARTMPQAYVVPALAQRFITGLLQELDRFSAIRIRAAFDAGGSRFYFETIVAIQEPFMSDEAVRVAQAANMVFSLAPGFRGVCLELAMPPKVSA